MDPYCVTISRKGKENFGIVLKSTSQGIGSILERVVKGSAADQCCECRIGDRLLAVNNLNVLYLDVRIAAFFIETSGNSVTLMFWPSERGASDTPVSMQWEESLVNVELHLELSIAGGSKNMPLFIRGIAFPEYMKKGKLLVGDIITEIKPKTAEIVTLASGVKLLKGHVTLHVKRGRCRELTSSVYSGRTMHRTYPYSITVSRQKEDFGFIIEPYKDDLGSVLANVVEGSPAEQCGQCYIGHRILAVDDYNVFHMDFRMTLRFIQKSGNSVTLTFCPSCYDFCRIPPTLQKQEEFIELKITKTFVSRIDILIPEDFQNPSFFVASVLIYRDDYEKEAVLVGDQILEINGKETKNLTCKEVSHLIKMSIGSPQVLVKRGCCSREERSTVLAQERHQTSVMRYQRGVMISKDEVYNGSHHKEESILCSQEIKKCA